MSTSESIAPTEGRNPQESPGALIRRMRYHQLITPAEATQLLDMAAAQLTARRLVAAGLRTLAGIANDTDDWNTQDSVTRQVHAIYTALTPALDEQGRDTLWNNLRATVERLTALEDDQRCTDLDQAEHGECAALLAELDAHAARILDGGAR